MRIAIKKSIISIFIRDKNFFETLISIVANKNLKIVKDTQNIVGYIVASYLESTFVITAKEEIQPAIPVYCPN